MRDFFEEYGWLAITIVGGLIGITIAFALVWGPHSQLAEVVNTYMYGVMKSQCEPVGFTLITDADSSGTVSKGDIITFGESLDMNGDGAKDSFKVMKMEGNEANVIAMDTYKTVAYNTSDNTDTLDSGVKVQKYVGSNLDQTMTAYYNVLPDDVKKAVVSRNNMSYSAYEWISGNTVDGKLKGTYTTSSGATAGYTLSKQASINIGTKYVYAPDIDDFANYYGGTVTEAEIQKDFFGNVGKTDRRILTRSVRYGNDASESGNVCTVSSSTGAIGTYTSYNTAQEVHPMFAVALGSSN